MTDKINDGGPAFPHQKEDGSPYWGMSLRDWFAGQALSASGLTADPKLTAEWAYLYADAMLEVRKK